LREYVSIVYPYANIDISDIIIDVNTLSIKVLEPKGAVNNFWNPQENSHQTFQEQKEQVIKYR